VIQFDGFCKWKRSSRKLYTFLDLTTHRLRKMQQQVLAGRNRTYSAVMQFTTVRLPLFLCACFLFLVSAAFFAPRFLLSLIFLRCSIQKLTSDSLSKVFFAKFLISASVISSELLSKNVLTTSLGGSAQHPSPFSLIN
jgi:hypothetical protein